MTPRVTLRQALEDPALLWDALGGDAWHTWRSVLFGSNGSVAARRDRRIQTIQVEGMEHSGVFE